MFEKRKINEKGAGFGPFFLKKLSILLDSTYSTFYPYCCDIIRPVCLFSFKIFSQNNLERLITKKLRFMLNLDNKK